MTGGIVVVLGRAGRNFGAGMSNGVAYVLDEANTFHSRVNADMVALEQLEEEDERVLHRLIREHEDRTASPRARQLLVEWEAARKLFRRVVPRNAPALVAAARASYLRSVLVEGVEEVRKAG
jgi:glutamate synthase domain-containing protein 3